MDMIHWIPASLETLHRTLSLMNVMIEKPNKNYTQQHFAQITTHTQKRVYPSRGPKRGIELGPLVSLKVQKIILHFFEYLVANTKYVILISLGINHLLSFFMAVS